MKRLFITLALLAGFSTAHAYEFIGTVTCPAFQCAPGGVVNETNTTIWTTHRMLTILGCAPNTGNGCPEVEPGETYHLHVKVRCGVGPACAHADVTAVAGPIPTIGNSLEWYNVVTSWSCGFHPNWFK